MENINKQESIMEVDFRSPEMEVLEREYEIHHVRHDLNGDVLSSAKLVAAAFDKKWEEVDKLLAAGADPRICRRCSPAPESALYYALVDQNIEMAEKLYHAGDRLDDLWVEDETPVIAPQMLYYLANAMRCGWNYFYDESKTLSECCRCSAYKQIAELLPQADKKELTKSVPLALRSWIYHPSIPDTYFEIISDLIARGAEISELGKTELLEQISCYEKFPAAMRAGQEDIDKMKNLIQNA